MNERQTAQSPPTAMPLKFVRLGTATSMWRIEDANGVEIGAFVGHRTEPENAALAALLERSVLELASFAQLLDSRLQPLLERRP